MGKWSELKASEKARVIQLAILNGVSDVNTIRDTYNIYAEGGDTKTPTKEEYIADKIDSVRVAALESARRTPSEQSVRIYKTDPVLAAAHREANNPDNFMQGNIFNVLLDKYLGDIDRAKQEYHTYLYNNNPGYVDSYNKYQEALRNGDKVELANCIANLSRFYPQGLPNGNQTFAANPGKWGFTKIDTWDALPGDLVQHLDQNGTPGHAMMYNGIDQKGVQSFNYANGQGQNSWGVGKHYPDAVSPDKAHLWDVDVYRYTGTPQDSARWIAEWMTKFGPISVQHKTGGPLYPFSFGQIPAVRFDEGGSTRNWDNTLAGKLINYVENSDSIGWVPSQRIWQHPTLPGYDKNQIGMGVDKNRTEGYAEAIKVDKDGVPYMTEEDERRLRHAAIEKANASANQRYKYAQTAVNRPKGTISKVKDAAVVSAIYNLGAGFVARGLFEDRDFMLKLFDGTDKEVIDRINLEYQKKKRNERVQKTNEFLLK